MIKTKKLVYYDEVGSVKFYMTLIEDIIVVVIVDVSVAVVNVVYVDVDSTCCCCIELWLIDIHLRLLRATIKFLWGGVSGMLCKVNFVPTAVKAVFHSYQIFQKCQMRGKAHCNLLQCSSISKNSLPLQQHNMTFLLQK